MVGLTIMNVSFVHPATVIYLRIYILKYHKSDVLCFFVSDRVT